ncbi:MAG: hypothetical protein HC825_06300 [Oscillatoriales cyanobacterium RM1_1_9]|nr:hypothetical protein [Oscillatoriales cyanobacterium RM1_1_9]
MTIRTLEQLSDSLAEDLAWRKKELANLKFLIETSRPFSQERVLLRSRITILYAHWEGFIKNAASNYLEYVAMKKLRYDELSSNFVALALKTKLSQVNDTSKATVFTEAIDFIRGQLTQRSSVPYKDIVQTGSNLSSSVLKEITCILGLDYSLYETKQKLIDSTLLAKRNYVAHGEYLNLEKKDYLQLHSQVIDMMDTFRNQIDNCASVESYRC